MGATHKFLISQTLTPKEAEAQLRQASHLSEGERQESREEYYSTRGILPVAGSGNGHAPDAKRESACKNRRPLSSATVSSADVEARIAAGEITITQGVAMLTSAASTLTIDVNPSTGTICLYGLSARFPVALYRSQWGKLLAAAPAITGFVSANSAEIDAAEARGKANKG